MHNSTNSHCAIAFFSCQGVLFSSHGALPGLYIYLEVSSPMQLYDWRPSGLGWCILLESRVRVRSNLIVSKRLISTGLSINQHMEAVWRVCHLLLHWCNRGIPPAQALHHAHAWVKDISNCTNQFHGLNDSLQNFQMMRLELMQDKILAYH